MDHMDGYGHGGWMGLWWIGGIALLILLPCNVVVTQDDGGNAVVTR